MTTDPRYLGAARSAAYLARALEIALGEVGLSLPQYRLLGYLSRGSSGASPAARDLSSSKPSVTALVDGVVAKGLVERLPHLADRRRITLTLTPAGIAGLRDADCAITARLEALASYLPIDDADRALDALSLWADAQRAETAATAAAAATQPRPPL